MCVCVCVLLLFLIIELIYKRNDRKATLQLVPQDTLNETLQ